MSQPLNTSALLTPPEYHLYTYFGAILGVFVSAIIASVLSLMTFLVLLKPGGGEVQNEFAGVILYFVPIVATIITIIGLGVNRLIARGLLGLEHVLGGEVGMRYILLSACIMMIGSLPLYGLLIWLDGTSVGLVFAIHTTLLIFLTEIITSIVSNYRYILLSVAAAFFGLILSITSIMILFVVSPGESQAELYGIVGSIALGLVGTYIGKYSVEAIYSWIFGATGSDPLARVIDDMRSYEDSLHDDAQKSATTFQ